MRQVSDGAVYAQVERLAEGQEGIRRSRVGDDDAGVRRLMACLRLDIPVLERDFTFALAPAGDDRSRTLTLLPSTTEMRKWVARIVITLDGDDRPQRIVIDDIDGARGTVTVQDAVYDQPIPPERFATP